jgi:hypothetical protein
VGETGLVGKAMAGRVVRMLRSPGVSSLSSLVNDLGSINCCEGKADGCGEGIKDI